MKACIEFKQVSPVKIYNNDYILLKDDTLAKIAFIYKKKYIVFNPKTSLTTQVKNTITIDDIKFKLELWAYDENNNPIAKISNRVKFVKQGDVVDGVLKSLLLLNGNILNYFSIKCPHCKTLI